MLKRKIDQILINWKQSKERKPLIISGARQVGKSTSIANFGKTYKSFINIDFKNEPIYKSIFKNSYMPKDILREISLINPNIKVIDNDTLILFDEIQECPDALTSLKPFKQFTNIDIICSGSLLGVNYKIVNQVPVGFKQDIQMHSLDFEEFLWANGYDQDQLKDIYNNLINLKPLSDSTYQKLFTLFNDYIFVGGMPEHVDDFIKSKTFSNVFDKQKQLLRDYEDDIVKYVDGLDASKVKRIFRSITPQLAKSNHKFQISKIDHGARSREYVGVDQWLIDAGLILKASNLTTLQLPLNAYANTDDYRIYFADHSLFIASLDEQAKNDLIINQNYNIYFGALYESLIASALNKQNIPLYFYRNKESTIELDFVIRINNQIVPIEVKKNNGRIVSAKTVIANKKININKVIKLANKNIGYVDDVITIPYFLSFMLKNFIDDCKIFK